MALGASTDPRWRISGHRRRSIQSAPPSDWPFLVRAVKLKERLRGRRRVSITLASGVVLSFGLALAMALPWPAAPEVVLELGEDTVFSDLPPLLAELKRGSARAHVIKIALAVEVPKSQQAHLDARQIAIQEALTARFRRYERRELEGSGGADRLRAEILAIINTTLAPAAASRVLYRQLIID